MSDPASANGDPSAAPHPSGASVAPDVLEALRQLSDTGKASLHAGSEAGKAFRSLLAADVSLARSAFGRTLAMTGVAIVFGASAWLLMMAAAVVWLIRYFDWPWSLSLLACGLLSLVIAGISAWLAQRYFEHTRLQATRRQLARLGIGELSKLMPSAGSGQSAKQAAKQAPTQAGGEKVKDSRGVEITPP